MTEHQKPITFRLLPLGDSALMIDLADNEDTVVLDAIAALTEPPLAGAIDTVPTYGGVTLFFDPLFEPDNGWHNAIEARLQQRPHQQKASSRCRTLPVCYHSSLAPDLEHVAKLTGLSPDEIIERHSVPEYRVRFLGFSPGFAFLTGLDPALHVPRKDSPRLQVPSGAVGLAGAQTGIYPKATPGGWQLIGQTPQPLLDYRRQPPTYFLPGDRLKFEPVSLEQFQQLQATGADQW